MELAAIAGLLGIGYMISRSGSREESEESEEGFATAEETMDWDAGPGVPPPLYPQDKLPPGAPTMSNPGLPRQPLRQADSQFDLYYNLPSGGSLPSNPATDPDLYPRSIVFSSSNTNPKPVPLTSVTAQVRMNTDGEERMPTYTSATSVVSALTGLPIKSEEFTHNNMVPFYRGSLKQNMSDTSNRQILDSHVGSGSDQIAKREQAPLFDPHREPVSNINGMESITSFVQDRMLAPTSRAGERPVEPTMVGPGVGEGFSSLPKGGFQKYEINEIARQRLSVDELRAASNPKITYEGIVVPGKSIALQRGDLGETRKYRPDTFFLNEHGERNFVTASDNSKPMERATEVIKYQSRVETSAEFMGPAASTDFSATYAVPSFRAPLARQHDGYGMRNADGSTYGISDTDAPNNDFGASSYDLLTNQRNVTSERGQGLNLATAGTPQALTVYDPTDVTRATVRESTGANDFIGISSPDGAAPKRTVYDPNDVTRTTFRELSGVSDYIGVSSPDGAAPKRTVYDPNDVTRTTFRELTGVSDYVGVSSPDGGAQKRTVYDPNDVARTTFREMTGASDYVGVSSPDGGAQKLTVYDPTDITRITMRNVTAEPDKALNVTRAGMPGSSILQFPDGVRLTTKGQISASSAYGGVAGAANAKAEQVYDAAYNMRQYPTKEILSSLRKPIAGAGNIAIFNGEDYVNQTYRKPMTDALNDRGNASDRAVGPPLGKEALGLQRPRNILKMDISRERNIHEILETLDDNPYALPVYKIAQGGPSF